MNNLKAIALSFSNTPIDIRELVVLGESQAKRLLELLKEASGVDEAIIISTCNRTEVYYASDLNNMGQEILSMLTVVLGDQIKKALPYFESIENHDEAAKRLFEVSIGVHSKVIGDLQITSQVKKAYQWSVDMNMAGPQLHRLLHTIFYANKRIVQETAFRDGAASVSYAAKELAEQVIDQLENPVILVVGLGEIGADFCGNIAGTKARVVVSNRTPLRSEEIAAKFQYEILPFENAIAFAKTSADVIVTSISTSQSLFKATDFSESLRQKCFIDLGVPRNVDSSMDQIEGIITYTIDELNAKTTASQQKRLDALDQVHAIIQDELEAFGNWSKEMLVSPVIKKLKNSLEDIRKEEVAKFIKNASEKEVDLVEKVPKSMMQKIIKLPVL